MSSSSNSDSDSQFGGYIVVSIKSSGIDNADDIQIFIAKHLLHMPFFKAGHVVALAQCINVYGGLAHLETEIAKLETDVRETLPASGRSLLALTRAAEIARQFPVDF